MGESVRTTRVPVGRYELEVGAPAGTRIVSRRGEGDAAALAQALRQKPQRNLLETANEATARVEDGAGLVNDVLSGALIDPQRAVKDVDLLLELLQRRVGDGALADALRVARAVNGALALLLRWADLVHTLRTALAAAEHLRDEAAVAWAHHELGTLHVSAEQPAAAQRHLEEARRIRRELGDQEGLAATEHNLGVLCRQLRDARSQPGRRLRRALLVAAATLLLLFIGAVASAFVRPHHKPELVAWVEGQGRIASAPAGIDCAVGRCAASFDRGRLVTLTAKARPGARFAGWSGDCRGRKACHVVLDQTRTVTAHFAAAPHTRTVQVQREGAGRVSGASSAIDCGTVCTAHVRRGTSIRLVARALDGATFAGWFGPCTGTRPICTLVVHGDVKVTARFRATAGRPTLTVTRTGDGGGSVGSSPRGIACGSRCVTAFPAGSTVVLTAAPAKGSRFTGWSGACTVTATTCTVTLRDSAAVSARFEPARSPAPRVTVRAEGDGAGRVTSTPAGIDCGDQCSAPFRKGTPVVLTAAAEKGSTFAGWSGPCTGTGSCPIDLQGDIVVTARFTTSAPARRTLTTVTTGQGAIEPSCAEGCSYDDGASVKLTAIPAYGGYFGDWSGCTPDPSDRTRCTVTMSGDRTVSASFYEVG